MGRPENIQRLWLNLVSVVVVAFAYWAAVSQFCDFNPGQYGVSSLAQWCLQQQQLAGLTNIVDVEGASSIGCGQGRNLDLILPSNARVYMNDMLGSTNGEKGGLYFYLTYFLFPRDVGVSVDQPARWDRDGFRGTPAYSYEELETNGFNVVVETFDGKLHPKSLGSLKLKTLVNPDWYPSRRDGLIAFLLPLFTALSGLWLLKWVVPGLYPELELREKLACGLGLGVMAVAAVTLGAKLSGFHAHGGRFWRHCSEQ